MNDLPRDISRPLPTIHTATDLARRAIAVVLIWLLVPLGVAPLAFAQEAPPPPPDQYGQPYDQGPPPQQWNALSPYQLQQLVAPVALYPDALLAQVLAASTYPTQVIEADRFVRTYSGYPPDQLADMVNQQPWDPSIRSIAAFPSVLADMGRNIDWTTQLGNAYYNQPQDVMEAVQVLRQQAYLAGRLRSTPQLAVYYQPGNIVIDPYNPGVVYVPYYNPWAIWGFHRPYYRWYGGPPPSGVYFGAGLAIGFGVGIVIASWSRYNWGWGHWRPYWRGNRYIEYDRHMYVPRSQTVFNHGHYGYFDRNRDARDFNRHVELQSRQRFEQNQRLQQRERPGQARPGQARPGQARPPIVNRPAENFNRQRTDQQRQRIEQQRQQNQQRQNEMRQQNQQRQRFDQQQRQNQQRQNQQRMEQQRQQNQQRQNEMRQQNQQRNQQQQQRNREVRPQGNRQPQQEKRQEKERPRGDNRGDRGGGHGR